LGFDAESFSSALKMKKFAVDLYYAQKALAGKLSERYDISNLR